MNDDVLISLSYRDNRDDHIRQQDQRERWQDHGLGQHYRDIFKNCDQLQSQHVLAWMWVISPAPDLMALVPEDQRVRLIRDLTEKVVEDYYASRDFDTPEYSYVVHNRLTEGETPMQHLHTHVVLPGTAPFIAERQPVYNNATRGHDALFRDIATRHFSELLDQTIGMDWRRLREPERDDLPDTHDLDAWFPRR